MKVSFNLLKKLKKVMLVIIILFCIITHTPGTDGNYYLLVDFQKVELDTPIRYYDGEHMVWSGDDKDIDGILDRDELGSRERGDKERINILPFVKKMVEKELYGEDDESIRSAEGQLIINSALATMKYNVYKEREDFYNAHINDNIQDRKEIASNYLNVDDITRNKILAIEVDVTKTNAQKEAEIRSMLSGNNAKLEVTLWNYESNPDLIDTDFDGIDDGYGYEEDGETRKKVNNSYINDKNPKDNHFKGKMNSTRLSGDDGIEVEMNMDYRYFLMSNRLYYDELSTMSLLMANSIYMRNSGIEVQDINNEKVGTNYKNLRIKDLMSFYGFKDVEVYYMGSNKDQGYEDGYICKGYSDTHKGAIAIGHRNIEYHGISKEVIGIVCRGTAEDDDWDNDFDIGDLNAKNNDYSNYNSKYLDILKEHFTDGYKDWNHNYHHAGFDIVANRELEVLNEYIVKYDSDIDDNKCYWITGHSMGAAVANLIAAHLINEEQDNVYCYTFAAPNNFYMEDNYDTYTELSGEKKKYQAREPKEPKYRCIFNIVNSDDFVPKVPMNECGWTKYGQVAELSIEKDIKLKLYGPQLNHSYYEYAKDKYMSNQFVINVVISLMNLMYENKNNMRNETYIYDSKNGRVNVYFDKETEIKEVLDNAQFSKPYQKYEKGLFTVYQNQMPAYFMQRLANAMHERILKNGEYVDQGYKTFLGQKVTDNQYNFINTKMAYTSFLTKWSVLLAGGPLNAVNMPHYIESYYTLTKEIETKDFR